MADQTHFHLCIACTLSLYKCHPPCTYTHWPAHHYTTSQLYPLCEGAFKIPQSSMVIMHHCTAQPQDTSSSQCSPATCMPKKFACMYVHSTHSLFSSLTPKMLHTVARAAMDHVIAAALGNTSCPTNQCLVKPYSPASNTIQSQVRPGVMPRALHGPKAVQ